ncbi:hypothetical protein BJ944DRAFT_249153 [Cunninghamella echinulata]|nr:hypothetical protein BJ944DRAFT_249153 [Cunninghamella echinulata]
MVKIGKALAVSMGALAGGAAGFYLLEAYKIKTKEKRLALLLEKRYELEKQDERI